MNQNLVDWTGAEIEQVLKLQPLKLILHIFDNILTYESKEANSVDPAQTAK